MAEPNAGFTAKLTIKSDEFDVLSFGTSFMRDSDQKGKPSSAVRAGELSFTVEVTEKETLIGLLVNHSNVPIDEGKVEFWQSGSGSSGVFRTVDFKNAYLTSYKEGFQPAGSSSFSADISITAEKITIGKAEYDAGWPTNS